MAKTFSYRLLVFFFFSIFNFKMFSRKNDSQTFMNSLNNQTYIDLCTLASSSINIFIYIYIFFFSNIFQIMLIKAVFTLCSCTPLYLPSALWPTLSIYPSTCGTSAWPTSTDSSQRHRDYLHAHEVLVSYHEKILITVLLNWGYYHRFSWVLNWWQ